MSCRRGTAVCPPRRLGVALHVEVLGELLVADGPALPQQFLDLAEDQGVALDHGRVVRLVDPDVVPDGTSLCGARQSAEPIMEFRDGGIQSGQT